MIIGRGRELARLLALVAETRLGHGGAVIVRGEPGIGKTSLLDTLADATGARVLRACGYEGETGLPFAALHDLLAPALDRVAAIPVPQARSIESALGLGSAAPVDPFATDVAVAALLQHLAVSEPLVLIVDDLQWLDPESMGVMLYVARRAARLRLAFVGAIRSDELTPALAELPALELGPLSPRDAETVLWAATDTHLNPAVVEALVEAASGNPLVLRELVSSTSTDELEGRAPLSDPLPISTSAVLTFRRRIDELAERTRWALLVAVAEGRGRLGPIAAALRSAGFAMTDLEPAERSGLISLDRDRVVFRHPVVRSVAYQAASADERRAAHRSLAAVVVDDDRRAWHLGRSVVGPDRVASDELRGLAERALARGADGTAARALERAAELAEAAADRAELYLKAARAANRSGDLNRAGALLGHARSYTADDAVGEADLALLDAELRMASGDHRGAFLELTSRIDAIEPVEPARALRMLLIAAKYHVNKMEAAEARRTVERAERLAGHAPLDSLRATSLAIVRTMTGDPDAASTARSAVEISMSTRRGHIHAESIGWPLVWLEEYELAERFLTWAEREQRRGGYHTFLPQTLLPAAELGIRLGRWGRAFGAASEARRLFEETDQPAEAALADGVLARLAALRGDADGCRARAAAAIEADRVSGLQAATAFAESALGHLDLSAGRYDHAVDHLDRVAEIVTHGEVDEPWLLAYEADLAEALVRLDRRDDAAGVVDRLERRATAVNRVPSLAAAARCRGLLSTSARSAQHFEEAMVLHGSSPTPFERGRTQLCHGELLRRAGQRKDARRHLRAALTVFEEIGAVMWAQRAGDELRASGETLRTTGDDPTALTAQERQVALRAARGATNKEVAAELFIKAKTVEFHLANVYRKLGVRSRVELAHRLPETLATDELGQLRSERV